LTAIRYLPPKLEEEFRNKNYQVIIDFINIQLSTYFFEKDKDKIAELLKDLYSVYLQKFVESNNIWEIF